MTGGFNGNFERWFAKEETRPKIKLDEFDPHFVIPKDEKKRDLSKPKKVTVPVKKLEEQKKKAEAPPVLSLEKLW